MSFKSVLLCFHFLGMTMTRTSLVAVFSLQMNDSVAHDRNAMTVQCNQGMTVLRGLSASCASIASGRYRSVRPSIPHSTGVSDFANEVRINKVGRTKIRTQMFVLKCMYVCEKVSKTKVHTQKFVRLRSFAKVRSK